ncbi:MAG: iron-containing alcohol dehydrogenase [Candidatus Omnitrophica bacterium]|nr:iron-containing alcohol dehydrogenase [Candidatus Omnitrophota bacterium]
MSDDFTVRSSRGDYTVRFTDRFEDDIRAADRENSFIVIDGKVKGMYAEGLEEEFLPGRILPVEADESTKTLEGCARILRSLIKGGIKRDHVLVAVGGGVIEDVVAFISTVLYRGINWTFYPTTLLAQADSCIGSKSSINFEGYKNLLGSFYPPSSVVIDTGFLRSLPEDEVRSGIGEILHFYLIGGKEELARKMMGEYESLIAGPVSMKKYILESLKIKKAVIERDELDKGERNLFNYGHTFGHAIESVTSYGINHGQAVTLGMDMANYLSMKLGYISGSVFNSMRSVLGRNIPDFRPSPEDIEKFLSALSRDKKNEGNNLGCILTRGPGAMTKEMLPMDGKLKDLIVSYFDNSPATGKGS